MSIRITVGIREQITNAVLRHRFTDEFEALVRACGPNFPPKTFTTTSIRRPTATRSRHSPMGGFRPCPAYPLNSATAAVTRRSRSTELSIWVSVKARKKAERERAPEKRVPQQAQTRLLEGLCAGPQAVGQNTLRFMLVK